MSSSVPSPQEIIESFPETPKKIVGEPTYADLQDLRATLKNNATSVDTIHGGGKHGHLGLVLPSHIYNVIVPPPVAGTNAWVDPVNPGLVPAYAPNDTPEQQEERREAHKLRKYCWRLCYNVDSALKKQLQEAIDPIYIRALRHEHTHFNHLITRHILEYLFATYGKIHPHNLADNDKKLCAPWDPSTPFEMLIDQVENAQEYATDGHQPYSPAQLISNAYNLVYQTGVYIDDCEEWDELPPI